jgi:arsenate reductase (thioredoxin)
VSEKCRVLFLCRANAARSIMAEALLRQLGQGKFEAYSAGVEPAVDVHEMTLALLRPTIGNLGALRPKSWYTFASPGAAEMDLVIALCDEVGEKHAPAFAGQPVFCEWDFPDPLAEGLSDEERRQVFDRVFRQILRRISVFVALPLRSMRAGEQLHAVNSLEDQVA